jgi:Zn-dependent peptidase ImmA (M78 family)
MMQRRQDWMRDYLLDAGAEPLKFIGSVTLGSSAFDAARRIREALGLVAGWAEEHSTWTAALLGLRRNAEAAGILVMINGVVGNNVYRKLEPKEFRGFVLCDRYAPLVFLNGSDYKAAQMFTLAHELVHLWLGREGVFDLPELQPSDSDIERFCNRVAAEVLIPEQELRDGWPRQSHQTEPYQVLARQFKVSPVVAARRAFDLGLIGRAEYARFYQEYEEDERRKTSVKSSGGDFYATQDVRIGRRFGSAVVQAAKEGKLLYRDAYRLTGLSGQTFDRFADSLAGGAGHA